MSVPSSVAIEDLQIFETKEACEAMFGAEMCDQLAQMQIVVNSLKNNIQTLITDYEREVQEIDTTLSSRADISQADYDALVAQRDTLLRQIEALQVRLIPAVTSKLSTLDAAVGAKLDSRGTKRRRTGELPINDFIREGLQTLLREDDTVLSYFSYYATQGRLPNVGQSIVDYILRAVGIPTDRLNAADKFNEVGRLANLASQDPSVSSDMAEEDIEWWNEQGQRTKDELDQDFQELRFAEEEAAVAEMNQ